MEYTVEDYKTKVCRGDIHPHTGKKLWGIRTYKGVRMLDWRTVEAWDRANKLKIKNSNRIRIDNKNWLDTYKLSRGCELCGFGKHKFPKKYAKHIAIILESDHLDTNTKKFNVCDKKSGSRERLITELDKCRVLCKPCHTEHTGNQNRKEENYE